MALQLAHVSRILGRVSTLNLTSVKQNVTVSYQVLSPIWSRCTSTNVLGSSDSLDGRSPNGCRKFVDSHHRDLNTND